MRRFTLGEGPARGHLRTTRALIVAWLAVVAAASTTSGQDADPRPDARQDTTSRFPNTTAGEFTPGVGFDLIKTKMGSLNISGYGLFRYILQMPPNQIYQDHLGRDRDVNARNDLNWHRTMLWFTGFFYDPRFRYNLTVWSLGTTQQTLVFGNAQFRASKAFTVGVGILPNLTARSMQGSWPFFAASDRQLGEEFFRGGFSSGVFATGEIVKKLAYTVSLNNNLSQLGVTQSNDTRDLAMSASLRWQPTTGEFGPRGGFGDFEYHTQVATQLGVSAGTSRESRYAPLDLPPNATQIKLSDGLNPFAAGAFADSVTVTRLRYREAAIDGGVKYRGFSLHGEYYFRTLDDFVATGPLPIASNHDHGFTAGTMYMAVPKRLGVYGVGSYVFDDFARHPWEAGGGLNFYPSGTRSWRINLHLLHVNKSPVGSYFSYYQAGQTGTIFSLGTDFIL